MWSPILEPVPPDLERQLRGAVVGHVRSETRRIFAPTLHVAAPGGAPARLPLDDQPTDHALRTDVVEAMCRRVGASSSALVWITRAGELAVEDVDLDWLAAARAAGAESGLSLHLAVVNRHSWRDPASGVTRSWSRLR